MKLRRWRERIPVFMLLIMLVTGTVFWYFPTNKAQATIQVFTTTGSWTVPTGVGAVQIECIGPGGAGGNGGTSGVGGSGGGGGGAYAKKNTLTVNPGQVIYYAQSNNNPANTTTGFIVATSTIEASSPNDVVCFAARGAAGATGSAGGAGGAGGLASNSIGDVTYDGGDGANGTAGETGVGGGGGASATSTGAGTDATGQTGAGPTDTAGGKGGNGGNDDVDGVAGSVYGGGGGGAGERDGSEPVGGAGGLGAVVFTYTVDSTAPTPNPPSFATPPGSVASATSVSMTASTLTDAANPVEYYFTATSADCGTNWIGVSAGKSADSGWQSSASYTDTGKLQSFNSNKCFGYTVTGRDTAGNYTSTSTASSTYTLANTPGKLTYTKKTPNTITIYNNENGNSTTSPATEYVVYVTSADANWNGFYLTSAGATTSSQTWLTDAQIDNKTLTSMATNTTYTFAVAARNYNNIKTATSTVSIKTAPNNSPTNVTLSGSGSWSVPTNVYAVQLSCWGGGGSGGTGGGLIYGGGSGGAFAKVDMYTVTPGASVSYVVGGSNATTTFDTDGCLAAPGQTGIQGSSKIYARAGGKASLSIGDWTHDGGYGGFNRSVGAGGGGGGGGGGATTTNPGNHARWFAANGHPSLGALAANGPGGVGGDGATLLPATNPQVAGGGGGGDSVSKGATNGAAGKIEITYWVTVPDTTPPTPNPYFTTVPTTTDTNSMDMTSVTVTDAGYSNPVNYYFDQVTGDCGADIGSGGTDSGWQSSASYSDTGLDTNKCYAYTVTAKDSENNVTATSTASSSYTRAATPGALTFVNGNTTATSFDIVNDANGNPTSNPATTFAVQVSATSPTDATWDGKYVDGTGNPSASAVWLTDAQIDNLTVSGLTELTSYTLQVKARNGDAVETSFSSTAATSTPSAGDVTPPTPNPYFTTTPTSTESTTVTMTSVTVTDANAVSYYFDAVAGSCGADIGTGGTDSGWQSSASYSDTGLQPNQCYAYTVTAKDSENNVTATSTASSTYSAAAVPGKVSFFSISDTYIVILNDANGNPASNPATTFAVQVNATSPTDATWDGKYVDGSGNPSASAVWLTDAQLDELTVNSISVNTTYTFQAKARNADGLETSWSQTSTAYAVDRRFRILGGVRFLGGVQAY